MQSVFRGEDGLELIVHAGLDTVELNGKYYQTYKEIGDQVKAGDVLLEFDLEEIAKAGYDVHNADRNNELR